MNSLQVEYFFAVVKHMNFSKAAQEKYISQPSISKHISNMEKELGLALFDRTGKQLQLTRAGRAYFELFQRFQAESELIQQQTETYLEQINGQVRVALLPGINIFENLIGIFDRCITANSKIDVQIYTLGFRDILPALQEGRVDVALLLSDFFPPTKGIAVKALLSVPKVIAFRKDLFPPDAQPASPKDFCDHQFLVMEDEENPYVGKKVTEYLEAYGFTPRLKSVPNVESMVWGVKKGDGVVVIDTWMQWDDTPPIGLMPITPPHTVKLAWRQDNRSQAVDVFVNELLLTANEL